MKSLREDRRLIKASLGIIFAAMIGLIFGNMAGSLALGLIAGAGADLIIGSAWTNAAGETPAGQSHPELTSWVPF